jgi:hypothetical protein
VADSRLAFDIVAQGGSAAAAEFEKVAAASDHAGNAMRKNSKISADAAKASDALTKARNTESTALDRVQIAEQKLSEVRGNSNAKTSQVLTAEKALARARRDAAVAGNTAQKAAKPLGEVLDKEAKSAAKDAGKGFLGSLKSVGKEVPKVVKGWFTGNGQGVFKTLGQNVGGGFLSSFLGVLKTPVIGPVVAAGLLAAVTAIAVPAGAVVAGGLVLGAGAGLAAIGLKFAAESAIVKQIWSKTASDLGGQMRTIAKPFEQTLISMSDVARRTFATFRPELAAAFSDLAPEVSAFSSQLAAGLGKLAPAIRPLAGAFKAVLGELGPALDDDLAKLSADLIKLSDSVSKNPTALADFARGIGDIGHDLVTLITNLNNADAAFKKLTGVSAVTAFMKTLQVSIDGPIVALDLLSGALTKLGGLTDPGGRGFHQTATSAKEAATATGYWTQGLTAAQLAAMGISGAVAKSTHEIHAANVAATLAAGAFNRQTAATNVLIGSLNVLSNRLLALSGAQIAYQQAVDDTTAAIKANGKTHDINTQKGRDNQTQLNTFTQSLNAQRDAMLSANDGNVKAAKFAEVGRVAYVKFAQQMGYNKAQAQALAAEYIKIPPVVRSKLTANITDLQSKLAQAQTALKSPHLTATKKAKLEATISNLQAGIATAKALLATLPQSRTAKLQANIADLQAKIATAKSQLADPHLTATKKANLEATIAQLVAQVNAAQAKINSLHGTTVTNNVVTKYSSTGVNLTTPSSVGRRASGGPVSKGVPYIVGEKRPELFVPNQSGTIIPKVPSMAVGQSIASGMAAGLRGGAGDAVSAAGEVAMAVIGKAKDVLGIASPSKAFAQLGLWVNQGFSIGLRGSAKQVQSAMSSLMSKVLNISFNAADTKKAIEKTITSLNTALDAARGRIKPVTGNAKHQAAAERGNRQAEASIRSIQAKLKSAYTDLANVNSIAARMGTTVKRNAIIAMLQRENVAMQKLANARAKVAGQLKAAQAKLAAAVQVRDDFKKQITDAALSFNSITNIQPDANGQLTASGIIAQMSETLRKTQAFAANLARLKKSGLNSTTYQQIAEAGVEQGGSIADALLSGGGNTFNSINRLQSNISSAAAGLGDTASKNLYQAGVDAAQGLVNGLLAKTKALDAASKKLADAIVAQIKKTLGIRSPSKVLEWHGSMAGRGFELGIKGEYGRVQKAAAGLGASARPALTRGGYGGGQDASSSTQPIIVQLILDGRVVQQALLKLKRTNGGTELGIA